MNEIEIRSNYRRSGNGSIEGTYSITPDTPELRTILDAICSSPLRDLANFAMQRHGYRNSDGGCGIIYPDELDEDDNDSIPDGYVQVYRFWGLSEGEEHTVPETLYLEVLALMLAAKGLLQQSFQVDAFRQKLTSA